MRPTILLIIALVLTGCGGNVPNIQPKAMDLISRSAADWLFMHGSGNPPLEQEPSGVLAFYIPNAPAALRYLQTPARLTTTPQAITLTLRVEATDAVYKAATFSSTDAAEFSATLRDLGYLGMTFGGHNSAVTGDQRVSAFRSLGLQFFTFRQPVASVSKRTPMPESSSDGNLSTSAG